MRAITKYLAGGAVIAAFACAAPAAAQYYPGYGNPYGYGVPGGGYGMNSQAVVNVCTNAVQARLSGGYGGYGYAPYGYGGGRVLGVSRIEPRSSGGLRVRGVATSGRYGGYNQAPDLTWKCSVDFRGAIIGLDINRGSYGYGYTPYNGYDYSQYGYRRY